MNKLKFIEGNNFQASFCNRQTVDKDLASEENLIMQSAVGYPMIWSDITSSKFKLFSGYIEADLLMNFTQDAIQKALVTFSTATDADS